MKREYILISLLLLPLCVFSQVPAQQQKKLALVIGNGNYVSSSILANPENDARAMQIALQSVGFTVMKYEWEQKCLINHSGWGFQRRNGSD